MLKNAPTLAIGGVDTEENEHSEVCPLSVYRSPRFYEDPEEEGERVARLRTALNDYVDPELCGITNNTVVHKDELKKTGPLASFFDWLNS